MVKVAMALLACTCGISPAQAVAPGGAPPCIEVSSDPPLPRGMVRPKYPKEALRSGIAGSVVLRATVTPDHKLKDLTVVSGGGEFAANASAAVRKWQFSPVSERGHAVETVYRVSVRFSPLLREANSDIELESPQPEAPEHATQFSIPQTSAGEAVHRLSEPDIVPPKGIYQPEPEFSEESRLAAEHGTVEIILVVGSDGSPRDLKIVCSSIPASNQNAIDAVTKWKFVPATKQGQPLAVAIMVEVSFKLYQDPPR